MTPREQRDENGVDRAGGADEDARDLATDVVDPLQASILFNWFSMNSRLCCSVTAGAAAPCTGFRPAGEIQVWTASANWSAGSATRRKR